MKRAFLPLFLIFGVFSASFAATNATDVYLLAKTESTSELKKVENIDIVDSDGNTALCSAIKYDDVEAYNILKKAGANTEHKCTKKIPSEQYKTFIQKVGAANKSWSFLGLGKWAWAAIGAGVVAGGAAAAMGGGGGGGSSGETLGNESGDGNSNNSGTGNQPEDPNLIDCVHGTLVNNACICQTGYTGTLCDSIANGFIQGTDGNVYPDLGCQNGNQVNDECVCDSGYVGTLCDSIAPGFILGNDGNVYPILPCVQGYQVNGVCVCYTDYYGTLCNMKNTSCTGYDTNGRCIIVGTNTSGYNNYVNKIDINNHIYGAIILGLVGGNGVTVYNAQARATVDSVITIENDAELPTDIYGIKSVDAGALNAYHGGIGTINITSHGTGNVYGIYVEGTYNALNASSYSGSYISFGNISINTDTFGSVYGVYSTKGAINATNGGRGTINITSNDAVVTYGLYGADEAINATGALSVGNIIIDSDTYGNVYGIFSGDEAYNSYGNGTINMTSHGTGNVYGLYGTNYAKNVYGTSSVGSITIDTDTSGNVYGIFSGDEAYNAYGQYNVNNGGTGTINIVTNGTGNTYGMYGDNVYNSSDSNTSSELYITNIGNGQAIGIYANTIANNSGLITINNIGTGAVIGILGNNNSTLTNSGTIDIIRTDYTDANDVVHSPTGTAGNVFGIYAKSGSTVNNSGTINISTNGNAYGIYAEGNSIVTNTGTITLNSVSCNGAACDGSSTYGNHIVLNGGTLYNSGLMMAPQMNLNSMGGNVVAGLGSQFVVDNELSGDLNISSELVQSGNQTTYIAENMIDAGDISGLNVRSASAMFDASLADNGHDVVMQMKDFDSLTDNKSLAAFLANNYANGNGMDLFATLKSMENMSAFNGTLSGLTGLNTFTQFAHEDLSAMREISFSMNNKLFENSGRDSFDISDSMGHFSFSSSHNSGSGQYGISSDKISDNWKLGYGMAMANINTSNGDGFSRQNKMWLFYMPATYTNDGYELVIAPKAGFANSEYSRRGYNNVNYEGYIEKRIFGLMNDLRYPLSFGNWTFAPDMAFNAIVYTQSGHEEEREFGLVIPDDRTVSVETGLGLYTKYEKTFESGSRLKLNSGLMAYREFGDSYDIKLGIRGMDGTFNLYNNDYKYRGAASMGFDYLMGRFHLYGNAQYFMDNANYMNFKGGVSYRF